MRQLVVLCVLTGCTLATTVFAQPATTQSATPDDGQWVMVPKDYANTRYSRLDQINTSNAKELKEAWTFWTGTERGHEAAPLVVGDTMYFVTPFPNFLYAIDLKNPKGPPKWKYEPKPRPAAKGVACCDYVNRGAAYWEGRVIINTLDGHTIAVNAKTGEELWKTRLADINLGETITMAPLVVKGKVLVGNSGGEFGVRGCSTQSWGLSPWQDQQLAGLIMWIPAGVVYIVAALALMAGWMRHAEARAYGPAPAVEVAS